MIKPLHMPCRQNLEDAARSDDTLRKLVDDNQAAFAAVGLGSLPDVDGAMGWVRGNPVVTHNP